MREQALISGIVISNECFADMKEINADKKRRFKIGVLHLSGNVLNENTYKPTSEPFTNPTSSLTISQVFQNHSSYELSTINQNNSTEATFLYIN